jgi:carbonic anhydrase/acetyltransferase-like protein (isoleucine patch superfamily)
VNPLNIYCLGDRCPQLGAGVYIAPTAAVIGDVILGDGVSVWFGAVLRGDETSIVIGAETNLQDGVVVHSNRGGPAVSIGERVTVGHGARLHGCRIAASALIGISATVLDGAVVESGAIVAAGALIPPRKHVGAGELWAGTPAVFRRAVTEAEARMIQEAPAIYLEDARRYLRDCAVKDIEQRKYA